VTGLCSDGDEPLSLCFKAGTFSVQVRYYCWTKLLIKWNKQLEG